MTPEVPGTATLVPQPSAALTLVSARSDRPGETALEWRSRVKQEFHKWAVRLVGAEDECPKQRGGMKSQDVLCDQPK